MADVGGPVTEPTEPAPGERQVDEQGPRRSLLERLGLAAIAAVMAIVFGGLSLAAWIGGEVFLAVMAGIGALMTLWAALANLRRG